MSDQGAKIFVSYSRADSAFAQELVSGIEACGFDAFIDKVDIAHGEAWQSRLGDLINRADTIVWVVSPASLSSEVVAWELDTAAKASKRIVPVSYGAVDMSLVPESLRRLNFCFFFNRPFGDALKDLAVALRMDVGWLREHTRVADLARRWDERGRIDELLLRGKELDAVRQWSSARPANAPPLTDIQAGLIAASNRAQEDAERRSKRRGRRIALIAGAVTLLMTGLAGVSGFLMLQARRANAQLVLSQADLSASLAQNQQVNAELIEINNELSKPRRLSVAFGTSDEPTLELAPTWFAVARENIKSVVAVVAPSSREPDGFQLVCTAFLAEGGLFHPSWEGMTVIVIPQVMVGSSGSEIRPDEFFVEAPKFGTLDQDVVLAPTKLDPPLFVSGAQFGVAVFRAPDELTARAKPVTLLAADTYLEKLSLWQSERRSNPADTDQNARYSPLLSYAYSGSVEPSFLIMDALGVSVTKTGDRQIYMGSATTNGALGAPVFDSSSGELVGIHMHTVPLKRLENEHESDGRVSVSTWAGDIVTDIQANYHPPTIDIDAQAD